MLTDDGGTDARMRCSVRCRPSALPLDEESMRRVKRLEGLAAFDIAAFAALGMAAAIYLFSS